MVYNELCLQGILIKVLHSSIGYSTRTYSGAHNESTLRSVASNATSLVNLQKGSRSTYSSMREDDSSRPRSSKPSRQPTGISTAMGIGGDDYSSSLSLECMKRQRDSRLSRQKKNKKIPTTVAPIILQQPAPVNRSEEIAGFSRLSFTNEHVVEEWLVFALLVRLTNPAYCESNKDNISYKRSYLQPLGRSPYELDPLNPSYLPQPN